MKQWKPLIASLIVIALAWGGLALWKFSSAPSKGGGGNVVANTDNGAGDAPGNTDSSDLEYETVPLEDLPELDPLGLWPNDGMRISSIECWVMWQTTGFSRCRLLGTSDKVNWVDLGSTGGERHFLKLDLSYFGSKAFFAVEFDAGGKRYRSKPRAVKFGQGAYFRQREYRLTLSGEMNQVWSVGLLGDVGHLSMESFRTTYFPEDLVTFVAPPKVDDNGGEVPFGVQDSAPLGGNDTSGFIQIYDASGDTYDRVLIELNQP
ncbi:MAG: hypothetical protein R3E76_13110 [Planctomycetota bacterium]